MTRYSFGGEITHTVATIGTANALILAPSATVTFFDSEGGAAVTDFVLWNTSTGAYDITSTSVTTTTGGTLPRFQGPDGLTQLWAQDGGGAWLRLRSYDATGGGTDSTAVHKTGDETIAGVKSFTDGIAIPDGDLGIAATAGLATALANAATGGTPQQTDPIADSLVVRRSGATAAGATAVRPDEFVRLDQVEGMVGDFIERPLLADATSADATTWVDLNDLAMVDPTDGVTQAILKTGDEVWCGGQITYEASATGGIAFRFLVNSPGLTVAGFTATGNYHGLKLTAAIQDPTNFPTTSEDYGRRITIRYGSSINGDATTNVIISGAFGGVGIGVPVSLVINVKVRVVGPSLTGRVLRPQFRQKTVDGANPTILKLGQSSLSYSRVG